MRKFLWGVWVKTKTIVIIILSITIGAVWMWNYLAFREIKQEADWAYAESVRLQAERLDIKDDDGSVEEVSEEKPKTESFVPDRGSAVEDSAAAPPLSEIEKKIASAFPECPETAIAIAKAESRLKPNAYHKNSDGTEDKGIFQINSVHGYGDELYDIDINIRVARKIWEKRQWTAWSAYKNKNYLAYL